MQIDWGSHEFAKTGDWKDPAANIEYGCDLVAGYIAELREKGVEDHDAIRSGVARYNGQSGPDSPYSLDVMARADRIVQLGLA